MPKLLVVEDDEDLADDLIRYLQTDGYSVDVAYTGEEAKRHLDAQQYELIILDWELPDTQGTEICKSFREKGGSAPVLMLTGRSKPQEKEYGFEAGADDFLAKPFQPKELLARLKALLRRADRPYTPVLRCGDLVLDPVNLTVERNGKNIGLVKKELALLELFLRNRNCVFSVDDLINHVWTADETVTADTVRTHIKNLRRKIELPDQPALIETVHGMGYRLSAH